GQSWDGFPYALECGDLSPLSALCPAKAATSRRTPRGGVQALKRKARRAVTRFHWRKRRRRCSTRRMNASPKRVAAVVTEYRRHSHADVIVGKILEGYHYDGKDGPNLRLVSMYVDQFPGGDMSRDLAKKHRFAIT